VKISFKECGESIIFRVDKVEDEYKHAFEICYYQRDSKSYIKKFPRNAKDLAIIKRNYLRYAEEMFNQLVYFSPTPWEKALSEFLARVDRANINWWLIGSCTACIRGIPLNPHDVDIMIDPGDVGTVHDIFVSNIVEPIIDTGGWVTKDFGVVFLHARIDIASEYPQNMPGDTLEEVNWRAHKIRVIPIQLLLDAERRRGREDRVKLIEEYINRDS